MEAGAAPTFGRVDSLALYELSSTGDVPLAGYWAGYRPSRSSSFGSTITLEEAWSDVGGVYLFLNATPANLTGFLAALDDLIQRLSPTGTLRFLWLADPNQAPALWQYETLRATRASDGAWSVAGDAAFVLGQYEVGVYRGTALTPAAAPAFGVDLGSLTLLGPDGGYAADAGTAGLAFAGPSLGALAAQLTLANGGETPDDLARLGVELRYSTPAEDGSVLAVPMPILLQDGAPLQVALAYDPLNAVVATRSQLAFVAGSTPALGSTLLTTLGYGTTLTPIPDASAHGLGPEWNARLAFCFSPLLAEGANDDPYRDYRLAPHGAFALAAAGDRLALGLSGQESVGVSKSVGAIALFEAGRQAFAPGPGAAAPPTGDSVPPLLTGRGTTAYVTFLPPAAGAGLTYYAQPRQAPLYVAGTDLGKGFMQYHEMPAATLPELSAPPTPLPVGAYAGVDATVGQVAKTLEQAAIAPARRAAIGAPSEPPAAAGDGPPLAVTPQGLVAELTAGGESWESVVVANLIRPTEHRLVLSPVGASFQAALQSNEVFFVASNVEALMGKTPGTGETSVEYRLDPATLRLLEPAGVPPDRVKALDELLKPLGYPTWPTEKAFVDEIESTAGTENVEKILPVAGLLLADVEDWRFQLSPRSWRTQADSRTMMIFKYCGRSLEELVADAGAWGWPQAAADAGGSVVPTQQAIQRMLDAAAAAPAGTAYARFYHEIAANPWWNGVLFLNAPVAIAQFPQALQFLAAGIDTERFYAHHVGFSLTPFDAASGAVALGQTAVFGLIDYSDPTDLVLGGNVPLAFKTTALRVRFENAAVADFSAEVELMVNRLFGSLLTKHDATRGNNLVLHGGYQRQNGAPAYAFTLEGTNVYDAGGSVLQSVEVVGVQLQTATGTGDAGAVGVDFVLLGNLRFAELPAFDLFSWGPGAAPADEPPPDGWLRFGNLAVRMTFDLATPRVQTFEVGEQRLSFDLANSQVRPRSLAANFPVELTGFVASPNLAKEGEPPSGQKPEDLGYASVLAPLDQSPLEPPWYGLVLTLSLGTLGAIGGSAPLSLSLLAAWAPGKDDVQPVYLGLGIPGAHASGVAWSLQGVLRFGFRSIELRAADQPDGKRAYTLLLRRLALSILGWSFPPGNADVYMFGNPGGDPKAALGWYAAYDADEPKRPPQLVDAGVRRLAAGGGA